MEEVKYMKSVNNSAAKYLFTVNPNTTNLDAEKAYVFHTIIARSLFIYKRTGTDI